MFVDLVCELEKIFQLRTGFLRKVAWSMRLKAIKGTGPREGGVTTVGDEEELPSAGVSGGGAAAVRGGATWAASDGLGKGVCERGTEGSRTGEVEADLRALGSGVKERRRGLGGIERWLEKGGKS